MNFDETKPKRFGNLIKITQKEIDTANANAKAQQLETDKQAKETLKASAKAKLVAGEPLTEAEADTLVV